jgi:hypothetical protein
MRRRPAKPALDRGLLRIRETRTNPGAGMPERTVMEIMGWSTTGMAARYQHVTDPIRHEVAARVGGLLWVDQESK